MHLRAQTQLDFYDWTSAANNSSSARKAVGPRHQFNSADTAVEATGNGVGIPRRNRRLVVYCVGGGEESYQFGSSGRVFLLPG